MVERVETPTDCKVISPPVPVAADASSSGKDARDIMPTLVDESDDEFMKPALDVDSDSDSDMSCQPCYYEDFHGDSVPSRCPCTPGALSTVVAHGMRL